MQRSAARAKELEVLAVFMERAETATRLQLGTSRLEMLAATARTVFVDKSWVHFGDETSPRTKTLLKQLLRQIPGRREITEIYRRTNFQELFF
jgi:hypothetical protein